MSDRLKSLIVAFLLSALLWAGLITGGNWAMHRLHIGFGSHATHHHN
jgi:hypothetical protein